EAAIARAKARKAAQQAENVAPSAESETPVEAVPAVDPRKAAVEAAIARAKARKAAQQAENVAPSAESETPVEAAP
ncbi:electron transport complex subunit RsxC, partial [Klebsiella sp. 141196]